MRPLLAVMLLATACGGGKKATGDGGGGGSNDGKPAGDGSGSSHIDADLTCANVSTTVPAMHAQQVVTGLALPVYVTQPPGSTDLYVVEKAGKIRIVRGGAVIATPFLDVTSTI